jgi:phosphoribosyl-AMP cyclohydrolase
VSDLNPGLDWLDALKWDENGMIPAIAQDRTSGRVVMFAWMNRESLQETVASGNAVYWSRSRQRLWRKGEESGNVQKVAAIRADCDGDVLLLSVDQEGGIACHTGRESCFFHQLEGDRWVPADPVLKDPKEIYAK